MKSDDVARLVNILYTLDAEPDQRLEIIEARGNPPSKARPRFTRNGHTYTDPKYVAQEQALALLIKQAMAEPFPANVAVAVIFYRPDYHRIDADNMSKALLDASNGVAFADDQQVTAMAALVEYDKENPRLVAAFAPHVSSLNRSRVKPCEHCGGDMPAMPRVAKYCSKQCRAAGAGRQLLSEQPVVCPQCAVVFVRRTSSQVLCSEACRRAWMRGRSQPAPALPLCVSCGAEVSKQGYRRCRACWRADTPEMAEVIDLWGDDEAAIAESVEMGT